MDGEAASLAVSDHARALLAYLAVEAVRPLRREQLSGLLWPDRPESDARHSLRQALYQLREAIGDRQTTLPAIKLDHKQVQFDRSCDHRLDVTEFESLVSTCGRYHERNRSLSAECCQRLEQAVALYVDSFLHGFSLPGSPEFEVWQLAQQEHYQRQGIEALFQLGEHYEGLGEYGEACRCARRGARA